MLSVVLDEERNFDVGVEILLFGRFEIRRDVEHDLVFSVDKLTRGYEAVNSTILISFLARNHLKFLNVVHESK